MAHWSPQWQDFRLYVTNVQTKEEIFGAGTKKILVKAKRELSNFALFSHQFCSFECH